MIPYDIIQIQFYFCRTGIIKYKFNIVYLCFILTLIIHGRKVYVQVLKLLQSIFIPILLKTLICQCKSLTYHFGGYSYGFISQFFPVFIYIVHD